MKLLNRPPIEVADLGSRENLGLRHRRLLLGGELDVCIAGDHDAGSCADGNHVTGMLSFILRSDATPNKYLLSGFCGWGRLNMTVKAI